MSLTLELPESLQNRLERVIHRGGNAEQFALAAISTALDSLEGHEKTQAEEQAWWASLSSDQKQAEIEILRKSLEACGQGRKSPEAEVFARIRRAKLAQEKP
jgi:hypothetical protein